MIKVQALVCPLCDDTIYSRANHDFHQCTCGAYFVDGGYEYFRWGGPTLDGVTTKEIEIDATAKELYDDWNYGKDKFGLIKSKKLIVDLTKKEIKKCKKC